MTGQFEALWKSTANGGDSRWLPEVLCNQAQCTVNDFSGSALAAGIRRSETVWQLLLKCCYCGNQDANHQTILFF